MIELWIRDQWDALPAKFRTVQDLTGPTTLHWNGGGTKWASVDNNKDAQVNWMERRMRAVQGFHMNGRGWSDYAYSFGNDPWGHYLWEGRGLNVRTASQGTTVGNDTSHSIFTATGLGDPPVLQESVDNLDESVLWIANNTNAQDLTVGHRDWKQTACPGDFLYGQLSELNAEDEEPGAVDPTPGEPVVDSMGPVVAIFDQAGGYAVCDYLGEVQVFGTAAHKGDMDGTVLNEPIVDAEATPSGQGYYLVASDGGVFTFGDAVFMGGLGHLDLVAPVISIEVEPGGYWLAASDGGIFAFGGADFEGRPVVV